MRSLDSIPPHKKRGTKFTPTEREGVKAKVAELEAKGYGQYRIAEIVGLTQPQISIYLKQIREEWIQSQQSSKAESIARKVAQYEKIREEAWEAYERSKQDTDKSVEEFVPCPPDDKPAPKKGSREGSLLRISIVKTREGRLPANEYLSTIMKTLEAERQLLGLDEQPPGGNPEINVGVQVNNQITLKDILDAAARQMNVGRVEAPKQLAANHEENRNGQGH